jgi:hypothetical protein
VAEGQTFMEAMRQQRACFGKGFNAGAPICSGKRMRDTARDPQPLCSKCWSSAEEARHRAETDKAIAKYQERCTELSAEVYALKGRLEATAKAWPVLEDFVKAYKLQIYGCRGRSDFATDEAYEDACKLLGWDVDR